MITVNAVTLSPCQMSVRIHVIFIAGDGVCVLGMKFGGLTVVALVAAVEHPVHFLHVLLVFLHPRFRVFGSVEVLLSHPLPAFRNFFFCSLLPSHTSHLTKNISNIFEKHLPLLRFSSTLL